jgi:hypothetical protein
MFQTLETPMWLSLIETLTFALLLISLIYNRLVNWKKFNERTTRLETEFEQYQKDMKHYLEVCEQCRIDVRKHHEGLTAEHVTPALRDQVGNLVRDVAEIKSFLMEHPRI